MKKILLSIILFAAFVAGAITLPRDTPVFADLDLTKAPVGRLPERIEKVTAKPIRAFYARHPMAYYTDVYAFNTPDGSTRFAAP